ncbi:MFS transporter [Pseudodesulfovibrio sp. zrk46]|uniref:MFS transporter n=1 Tax=Pseudodesulfovibrio sp. zrk46 TaxID=2725288 RepID=UPI001449438F|nr:MFS transporter [Pseudodesulfovibrio sp. zrk46]QJB57525.1 MFS transporter [Pseudodesulfovibrio sp. zrk46]
MKRFRKNIGFIAATLSMLMAFAASATPIPLYDVYRRSEELSYSDLALTAVVYFIGAITALLIFGRISNHLGRKPVTIITFGLSAVATVLLLDVDGVFPLVAARLLLGLSCGLASSAIAAYVVDSAPPKLSWLSAVIVGNSPMVGLTLGALASGILVEYGPYPRMLCYWLILAEMAVVCLLIVMGKETVERKPGLLASFRPSFSLPHADRRLYPIAACLFVATWALGGFFQAYGPSIAADELGSRSTIMAAIVFASFLLPSAIGGPLSARLSPARAQRIGIVVFTLAVGGVIYAIKMSFIPVFLGMSAIAGAAQGVALTGSIRALLDGITSQERAGVLSLIYATSYTGAAVTSLLAGQLSKFMTLFQVISCYGGLAVVACFITLAFAREPQR